MRKLKLLHIGNGAAFKIRAIVEYMVDKGHDVHFIPTPPADDEWDGVTYHKLESRVSIPKLGVIRNFLETRKLVDEIGPDIVHAHNARGPGWYGAFSGRHPFVIHAYGSDVMPYYYSARKAVAKAVTIYTCSRADRIIVTGGHMVEASSHLHIPRSKIKLLPRGVDLERFRPGLDTSGLAGKLGITGRGPVILSPRYQIREALYNFDKIVESIAAVREVHPDVLFIQLYDPSCEAYKRTYLDMAEELGVGGNYMMVPAVGNDRMPLYYNLADISVSITSTDGFPVTVLEASACGTPMIVSKLDYTKEWFTDGDNGIVISRPDAGELSAAIVRLLGDRALMDNMASKNRALVEERADYRKCMDELERLYYELAAKAGRVAA